MRIKDGQAGAATETPSSGVAFYDSKGALDELCHLTKRFNDRLTLKNLRIKERYLKGDLNFLVEARWGAMEFNIVVHRKDASKPRGDSGGRHQGDAPRWAATEANCSLGTHKHPRHTDLSGDLGRRASYGYDHVVLVDDVEPMEGPSRTIPSTASFKPKDEPLGSGCDALYFSNGSGFKSFRGPVDVKPAVPRFTLLPSAISAVSAYKIADNVIKSGSKIVDGIPDDGAQPDWEAFVDSHAEDILSSIGISASNDEIWFGCVVPLNSRLQLLDVLFGPFNF